MSRDRSLEEFVEGTSSDATNSGEASSDEDREAAPPSGATDGSKRDRGRTGTADAASGPDRGGVTPIVSTYRWSPDGGTCRACGGQVRARWRDDGGFVCADCKEW